jgi:hypothetical protein
VCQTDLLERDGAALTITAGGAALAVRARGLAAVRLVL